MELKKAAKLISKGIDLIPKEIRVLVLEKSLRIIGVEWNADENPTLCFSDEEIELIREFGLNIPENLVRFLVEMHFAAFDSLNNGIENIRNDLLNETIAEVIAEKRKMRIAYDNYEIKDSIMFECLLNLVAAVSKLEKKIFTYCSEIKAIDDSSKLEYTLHSVFDKGKVIENGCRATAALQLYYEAVKLIAIIGNEMELDISSCLEDAEEFARELSENAFISVMIRYTKEKYQPEWDSERIHQQIAYIKELPEELFDIVDEGVEIDFENLE